MKRIAPFIFIITFFLSSCFDSDDETLDLQSPQIMPVSSSQIMSPDHFTEVAGDALKIPLAFRVEDQGGISEIVIDVHNGFDGHTHGRTASNNFVLLNYTHTIEQADMDNPRVFVSELEDDLSIYLDETNPFIPAGGLILAGPYHFSIKAADLEGNETSYADNTTYHTTMYVQRDYAPQIEVNAIDTNLGEVSGAIWQNKEHESSSEVIFLWVYIATPNPANPAQEGDIRAEWIWGESNWSHQFRPGSGADLTNREEINLANLLSGEEAIRQMTESELLTIWAEDANGNISVKAFSK